MFNNNSGLFNLDLSFQKSRLLSCLCQSASFINKHPRTFALLKLKISNSKLFLLCAFMILNSLKGLTMLV